MKNLLLSIAIATSILPLLSAGSAIALEPHTAQSASGETVRAPWMSPEFREPVSYCEIQYCAENEIIPTTAQYETRTFLSISEGWSVEIPTAYRAISLGHGNTAFVDQLEYERLQNVYGTEVDDIGTIRVSEISAHDVESLIRQGATYNADGSVTETKLWWNAMYDEPGVSYQVIPSYQPGQVEPVKLIQISGNPDNLYFSNLYESFKLSGTQND